MKNVIWEKTALKIHGPRDSSISNTRTGCPYGKTVPNSSHTKINTKQIKFLHMKKIFKAARIENKETITSEKVSYTKPKKQDHERKY
jgi:hypothetical protein